MTILGGIECAPLETDTGTFIPLHSSGHSTLDT